MRLLLSPLTMLTAAFCGGIAAFRFLPGASLFFWSAALVFLVLSLISVKKKICLAFLLLGAFFSGGTHLTNSRRLPLNHVAHFTPEKGRGVFLDGIVDSDPVCGKRSVSFVVSAKRLKERGIWKDVSGKVLIRTYGNREFFYGERLLLEGKLYRIPVFRLSGKLNYREYMERKNVYSLLSVRKSAAVIRAGSGRANVLRAAAIGMRRHLRQVINANLSSFTGEMLAAIILGERQNIDPDLKKALASSGTIHVIAISGLHFGIVSCIVLSVLKILRIPKPVRCCLTILILVFYCLLSGARISVIRATIMVGVLLSAFVFRREANVYNSLALAALIILFINPRQLFEAGFQLSFISVISIVLFSPAITGRFSRQRCRGKHINMLIGTFAASLSVWVGLFPLIAYYFGIVSPVAVAANILVVPLMAVVIACGFIFIFAGAICPFPVSMFSAAAEFPVIILLKIVSLASRVPGSHFHLSFDVPLWAVFAYYFLLFTGAGLLMRRWISRRNRQLLSA